jgi:hypothetical protein
LRDDGEARAEIVEFDCGDVDSIDGDASFASFEEPEKC